MKSTDAPSKQAVPFGSNGPREAITATTPSGSNQASYDQGFPPITMTLKSAGGLPPKGQDMNQILFEQSSFSRFFSAGGGYPFDATFAAAISGYPKGAIVPFSDFTGSWLNLSDDNSINPENPTASLTGWIPAERYGVTSITGLAASGVTVGTKDAARDRIILSGNLTANVNVVLPAWVKYWQITNNCTGSFSVTVKTAAGSGAVVPNGYTYGVFGDGVNISLDARGQYARVNGDASQQFSVKDATANTSAVSLSQMTASLALKANLGGSATQGFAVSGGTEANSAVAYGQFQGGNNGNGAWIKIPNGGQWCRHNMSIPAKGSVQWTYPAGFVAAPSVFMSTLNGAPNVWIAGGVGANSVTLYNNNDATVNVNLLAIW